MKDISAIVVTHNSEVEAGACLDSLKECGQLIVVDNASSDETLTVVRQRPAVEVLPNPGNAGFGAAVNQGRRIALGRYLLILNPDAVLETDCAPLMEACERHGIAAGCLTGPDGRPQAGFTVRRLPTPAVLSFEALGLNRIWPSNPLNSRYRYRDLDLTRPCRVEQPAAAFLMVRTDVFDALGGFDEDFWPVWFEDVDFCRRARDKGFEIAFVPSVRARHAGGHSVSKIPAKYHRMYWYGSLLRYAGKHYSSLAFRMVCGSVVLGSLFRWLAGSVRRPGSLRSDYRQVLRLAAASMASGRVVYPNTASPGEGSQTSCNPMLRTEVEASCRRYRPNAHLHVP